MSKKEVSIIYAETINDDDNKLTQNHELISKQTKSNRPSTGDSEIILRERQISYGVVQNLKSFHYFKFFEGMFIPAELFIINPKNVSSQKKSHYEKIIQLLQQQKIPHTETLQKARQHGYFDTLNCRYRIVVDLENLQQLIKNPQLISKIEQITVFNSGNVQRYKEFLQYKRKMESIQKCNKISKMLQSLQGYVDAMKPYLKYYKRSLQELNSMQPIGDQFLKPMILPAYFSSHELSQKVAYRSKLWAAVQSTRQPDSTQIKDNLERYKHFIERLKSSIPKKTYQKNNQQAYRIYMQIDRSQKGYLKIEENMVTLLALYKKQSFYYNVLNSMLRVCRRICDFEPIALPYAETYRSIKYFYDKFVKKNDFTRPQMRVYRGCRLQDLQSMFIGGYYEMLGFVSCSYNKQVVTRQFLKQKDSCLMIINIPSYKIQIDRLVYDHGLIDYKWLQSNKYYKQLVSNIVGKDMSYEQQVMLNSYTLLKLLDRKKQKINGRQIWVLQCELVSFNQLCERASELRKQIGVNRQYRQLLQITHSRQQQTNNNQQQITIQLSTTNNTNSLNTTLLSSQSSSQIKSTNNTIHDELIQIQRVLKNLQYFVQQMGRIRGKGDLYAEFGQIDNQQMYYRDVMQKISNNTLQLPEKHKRQVQFKYLQAMMKCGKLQYAHKHLLQLTQNNNNNNNKNINQTPIIKLSNYNPQLQQQIKTVLKQSDDLLQLRDSLQDHVRSISKKKQKQKQKNLFQLSKTMYQLGQTMYQSNQLSQCVQILKTTKQYLNQCRKQLGCKQQNKNEGCFDFFGMLSKLVGLQQSPQQQIKKLSPQKIKQQSLKLMQLQMMTNSLMIKCLGQLVDDESDKNIKDVYVIGSLSSNKIYNQYSNQNNNNKSIRNNQKLRISLIQQTLKLMTYYKQQYIINKNTNTKTNQIPIQMLVIQAKLMIQHNDINSVQKVINILQERKLLLQQLNPNDKRLQKLCYQLASLQAQQLSLTLSKNHTKFTILNKFQDLSKDQQRYRKSSIIKNQYKLTNTQTIFNQSLYEETRQKVQHNYKKSLSIMQTNGQKNTVKYIKVQNQLGYFYRQHNMLHQSDTMANRVTKSVLGSIHSQGAIAHLLLAKNFISRGEYKNAQQQLKLAQCVLHKAIVKLTSSLKRKAQYVNEYKSSQIYFQIEIWRATIYNSVGQFNCTLSKLSQIEQFFIKNNQSNNRLFNMMLINQTKATMLALGYKILPEQYSAIQWSQYFFKAIQFAKQYLGQQHVKIGDYYCSMIKFLVNDIKRQKKTGRQVQLLMRQSLSFIQKAIEIYSRLAFDHPNNCNLFYVMYLYGDKKIQLLKKGQNKKNFFNNSIKQIIDTFRYCLKLTQSRYRQMVHINLIKTKYEWFRFYCQLLLNQHNNNSNNNINEGLLNLYQTKKIGQQVSQLLQNNSSIIKFMNQLSCMDNQTDKCSFIKQCKKNDQKVGIKMFVDQKMIMLSNLKCD